MTAKDQSECQLISGTKQNKKRPGRWSWVVDLSKTDWQDTKRALKAHWQSCMYRRVNNLECKFFLWHVLAGMPVCQYSVGLPHYAAESLCPVSKLNYWKRTERHSAWNSYSLWLQIKTRSVSQIRLIYTISHLNDLCQTDFRWFHQWKKFLKVNTSVWRDNLCGILTAHTKWTGCSQHILACELMVIKLFNTIWWMIWKMLSAKASHLYGIQKG